MKFGTTILDIPLYDIIGGATPTVQGAYKKLHNYIHQGKYVIIRSNVSGSQTVFLPLAVGTVLDGIIIIIMIAGEQGTILCMPNDVMEVYNG